MGEQKNSGKEYTDAQIKLYSDCYNAYSLLNSLFNEATDRLGRAYTGQYAPEGGTEALEEYYKGLMTAAEEAVRSSTEALRSSIGYKGSLSWSVNKNRWYNDKDINEIYVDFA